MENYFYDASILERNRHPDYKEEIPDANYVLDGFNPSCGDEITLKLKIADGIIQDGCFQGNGCAVSQSAADMMLELIIGKSVNEAQTLSQAFHRMILGEASAEDLSALEDCEVFSSISHMPARAKCATLSWRTLEKLAQNYAQETEH